MKARGWRCRGCLSINPPRTRKCQACDKPRPPKRVPKHRVALLVPYEEYVALNGGEFCGVCLARPKVTDTRRFHRDHDHKTGRPRGILCFRCNSRLDARVTPEWLRAAADYLERAAA